MTDSAILEAILSNMRAQTLINKQLASSGETTPKQIQGACRRGEFINVMAVFDEDVAVLRCSCAPKPRHYRRPTRPEEMDFLDYLMCLLRLSGKYRDAGQTHLASQVVNLALAAALESATKTRQSIIRACERVRRQSTTPDVKWDHDSLNRGDVRSMLEPLFRSRPPHTPRFTTTHNRRRKFASDTSPLRDEENQAKRTHREPSSRASRTEVCSYWEQGKTCHFEPRCRFKHSCIACGSVAIHDPRTCKLRVVERARRP